MADEDFDSEYFTTDAGVAKRKQPGVIKDRHCLGLRVNITISKRTQKLRKVWVYRYRTAADKKLRQIKLGEYPIVSLAEARDRWRKEKAIRDDPEKGDPRDERQKIAAAVKQANEQEKLYRYSLKDLCEHYLTEHVDRQRKRSWEVWRMFERDIFKRDIAKTSAIEIKRSDIHELVQEIIARPAKRTAAMLRRELQAAFDHAISAGRLPDEHRNPCWRVKAPPQTRRNRAFTEAELAKFLGWLPSAKVSRTVKDAMHLELLTTARQGEIVAMEWGHVDLEQAIWTQPTSKNGKRHEVMLSTQALAVLKARQGNHHTYVFPRPDNRTHVDSKAIGIQQYAAKGALDIDDWTVHDLRRSALTGLSRLGCPRTVQNRISNHADSSIAAIYDRHDFNHDARIWLQKWADRLDELCPFSNVESV